MPELINEEILDCSFLIKGFLKNFNSGIKSLLTQKNINFKIYL